MWLAPSKIPWPASAQKCLCSWFYFTPAYIQDCKWAAMHLSAANHESFWFATLFNVPVCCLCLFVTISIWTEFCLADIHFDLILSLITVADYPLNLTIILIGMQVSHIIMIILSSSMVKVNLSLLNKIHLYVFFIHRSRQIW